MLNLSQNVTLIRVAQAMHHDLEDATERQVRKVVDALRKRRERRWNKALGRRADGNVIRPIPAHGRFRWTPVLDADHLALLRARVRASLESASRCESCGDEGIASVVYNPMTVDGYWPATLCASCQRSLNSTACQNDILAAEVQRAERRAGWSASA